MEAFAPDGDEPEDGGERAGDGEIGAEVDGDEDDLSKHRLKRDGAERGAGDESKGKIVEEVGAEGDGGADAEGGFGTRELHHALEGGTKHLGGAGSLNGFNDDEESGDEWQDAPADFADELDGIGAALDGGDDGDGEGGKACGSPRFIFKADATMRTTAVMMIP